MHGCEAEGRYERVLRLSGLMRISGIRYQDVTFFFNCALGQAHCVESLGKCSHNLTTTAGNELIGGDAVSK
jgi:hypothetical protein